MKDYIEILYGVLEQMQKLSKWRFAALVALIPVGIVCWRLPEILAVFAK